MSIIVTGLKRSMHWGIRQLLHSAPARYLSDRYLANTGNVVFIHIAGDSVPPHYRCFAPPHYNAACLGRDLGILGGRFRFVPLHEAISKTSGREARPRMAFTIDDGLDFYTDEIVQLFRQHGVTPYLFLITKYIGNSDLMWRHKLSAIIELTNPSQLQIGIREIWHWGTVPGTPHELLRMVFSLPYSHIEEFTRDLWEACRLQPLQEYLDHYRPYLSWERIDALRSEGFQFGSHSHSHPAFDLLDRDEILTEMRLSKQALEARLGEVDYYFAYPFGRLPVRDVRPEIHRLAGYKGYFGTFGFSRINSRPSTFYHRISTEGTAGSTELALLYPLVKLYERIRGHHNPRI